MTHPAFEDRTVTLDGGADALAQLAAILGSGTRLRVLAALVGSSAPLHINEIARRVGVDASPVRTHLELLLKAGIVREVLGAGRERRFETRLRNVRLVLEGVDRPAAPEKAGPAPKLVQKLERKLAALAKDMGRLESEARKLQRAREAAWAAGK